MTIPKELREVARRQNDADHAAGRLPSRYVTDPEVLAKVARILVRDRPGQAESAEGKARARKQARSA